MAHRQGGHAVSLEECIPVMAFSVTGKGGDVGLVKDKKKSLNWGHCCHLGHNVVKLLKSLSTQTMTFEHQMTASCRMA